MKSPKNHFSLAFGGVGEGVLSNMPEEKWGNMGENGSYCESYLMFC